MVKENKPLDRKTNKKDAERIKDRLKDLYTGPENLPASLSIRQAEELMARVRDLETRLAGTELDSVPEAAGNNPLSVAVSEPPALPVESRRVMPPASISVEPPQPARFPRLARLWSWLTGAHPRITETGDRQQAQLAAAISLGLGIFTLIGLVASTITHGGMTIIEIFLAIMSVIVVATYFVNRSPYYKWGSGLLVVGFTAAAYGLAISNPDSVSSSLFSILPISLIIGSLLLPLPGLAILTGINFLLVTFLLPQITENYTNSTTEGGIYLTLGILLTIAVAYRNSVERLRVKEVTTVNQELQAIRSDLENRVQDRTHDLELAAEVGKTITEKVASLQEMLTSAVELIRTRFNLYYTQVYLVDPTGKNITLRAGTGQVGQQLLQRGHRLPISSTSLNGRAVTDRKAVIVEDTSHSRDFLPNPLLPRTRSEMAIPLIAGDRVIGVLDMQSEVPGTLNPVNLPAFEVLAGQLSTAVQNASLFAQAQEARRQTEATVRRMTASGWQDFMNSIDRSEQVGYLFDQNTTVPIQDLGTAAPDSPGLSQPITITGAEVGIIQAAQEDRQWTSQDQEIMAVTAARLGQHIDNLRLLAQAERYRAEAEQAVQRLTREGWEAYLQASREMSSGFVFDQHDVQPLVESTGSPVEAGAKCDLTIRNETIGELAVETGTISDETMDVLNAVASQLSGHLENLRLQETIASRAAQLETVARMSATTSTVLDPDRLLQTIVDLTKERFGVYHAHIYLANEAWKTLLLSAGAGEIGRQMVAEEHSISMDMERSLVARASRDRKAVIVNDVRADPGFLPNPLLPETRAEMAVPMIVGDTILGVFDVQSDRVNGFSSEDASVYTTLASQVAVALQNARLYVEQAATVTQLRELDRLKSSFLANMSHELRTPLNSILGFSDVMLEELDGPLTENMSNDLRLIQKNGQHLLHLINDVLDMAKIEAGRMNLAPEKFVVHDVLDEVIGITSNLASDKHLDLGFEKDSDDEIQVFADRTRIRQVMINLVNNSIKFTDKGKVTIGVQRQKNDSILIAVRDTGIGIPPDQLETIFQEFAQVDTSTTRKTGGTGLGLPISRKLVEMHGGRLWAESKGINGKGASFYVELPLEAIITEPIEKLEKEDVQTTAA